MDRLANAVILSWGWRRRAIAFTAGALSALAQPPFFLFPVLWITFPVLVWLIDGAVARGRSGQLRRALPAFEAGWWFGFGYFLAGLWWIGAAFLVEAETFGWVMPLAVIALPAGLAVFWGAAAVAAQLLWSEDYRRVLALAVALGSAEWLRAHLLSGFPWNAIGYALTAGEILMQSAALFGIYALNVLAVIIFAAPAVLAPSTTRHRNLLLPSLGLAGLGLLGLHGMVRLSAADLAFVPETSIRIVQPSLGQLQKWDPANKDEVLSTYFRLSAPDDAPLAPGTLLVWPESAFPFALTKDPGVLAAVAELLPAGTGLITGAYREEKPNAAERRIYNTLYTIGDDGAVLDAYDKVHLVPFGEYLPAGAVLRTLGLRQMVQSGFEPGPRRRALSTLGGLSFVPLICYEAIFSGEILPDGPRPDVLLNVTNDGWFGRTIGPLQHFHQARIRAVEEGLPLVRAANTGISAIIDPYGRIMARTELNQVTAIESRLPVSIPATAYAQWRSAMIILLIAACLLVMVTKSLFTLAAIN